MRPDSKIYVAGHRGLVGSALVRCLTRGGFSHLVTRTRQELELTDPAAVREFFAAEQPEFVFLAAAKVGGIRANSRYPADFIRDNLLIQTHVIDSAYRHGVKRLVFLGSSCIYPRLTPQPMREAHLLSGPLEPTNDAYALAKIAGIKMVEAYRRQFGFSAISLMPCNLYGPGDTFSETTSHVIPALMRRFHCAKKQRQHEVTVWGSGTPRREFLHVDDMADATLMLMQRYDDEEFINVGSGQDLTIAELVEVIRNVVGYSGSVRWDTTQPDGTPRKLLDVSKLSRLGWRPRIGLEPGLRDTYDWFLEHQESLLVS
jgi:GDP-L-fucose synthase